MKELLQTKVRALFHDPQATVNYVVIKGEKIVTIVSRGITYRTTFAKGTANGVILHLVPDFAKKYFEFMKRSA